MVSTGLIPEFHSAGYVLGVRKRESNVELQRVLLRLTPPHPEFAPPSLSAMIVCEQEFPIVQYFDLLPQISLKNERCHIRSHDCTDTQQHCSTSSNIPGLTKYWVGPIGRAV